MAVLVLALPGLGQELTGDRTVIHGSLSVADAVETGLHENLMIQAAQADALAAEADTKAARSMTQPQVSANTYLTTGNAANILGSAPGVTPSSAMLVPTKRFADQNLTLMVPIYTGGRLLGLVQAARDRESAAGSLVTAAQADAALAIRIAYYRALLASELIAVAQSRVDANTELVRNARLFFEAGKGIEASVRRAEAELADAQRELTNANNDHAKTLLDLRAAMGISLDSDFTISDTLAYAPPTGDLASTLAEAAQSRPEILAARARIAAAMADTAVARGALQPQVYGTAMADVFSGQSLPSGTGGTVGLTISLPLFDAGQRRADIARARAVQSRAEAEARNTELLSANEVRQAWLDIGTAAQNVKTAESAVVAAQSAYDVTALRVQAHKGILIEQLDALAALTRARGNRAQALYDHAAAAARLQRAIGRI